jgi:hypothetical protein
MRLLLAERFVSWPRWNVIDRLFDLITDEDVHGIIGMAMVAIAHLNLRVEEMRMHESISGFLPEELDLFDARTRYLIDQQNTEGIDRQFRRVVSLMSLPTLPHAKGFDFDRFMKVRNSPECIEFRNWLSTTELWSDDEIIARVGSLREALSRHYQSVAGKAVRLLVSTGAGLLPGIGTAVGLVAGVLDTFLLDRILRPSGAIYFISSSYPSLFEQ